MVLILIIGWIYIQTYFKLAWHLLLHNAQWDSAEVFTKQKQYKNIRYTMKFIQMGHATELSSMVNGSPKKNSAINGISFADTLSLAEFKY